MDHNNAKVTVLDSQVAERGGTFEGNKGEQISYTTRKQKGRIEVGGFAYPVDIRLEDGQPPYAVGDYELDIASMLQVNKGVMSLSKFTALRSLTKPAARAA
ncbi:single-stranded DNA-binding protein [Stenotrophomonas sp. CFBP 13725]|uniref:single-stranded DNA-binding protein n=1 Tax=Stenotrophomonas sp. CFBP 13725 TaxID=2775297 RepID=UPI0017857DC2|nr:single-stranded DNA-binding protein [Stenotrophomonas sp. CFBP 13725]MBD8634472.1 single-stranded DNA-binding protein [Stenotrophomonas sp. CFBP 13725]